MGRLLRYSLAGVHTTGHPSQIFSITYATPCTAICYSVPWYSRHKNNCLCIRGVQQQEVYARLLLITVKWHLFRLPSLHLFPSHVFHACVYMFLFCVRPAVLEWGGVGEYVVQCIFATQPDSVYLHRYSTVTVTVGGLLGIWRNLWVKIHISRSHVIRVTSYCMNDLPPLVVMSNICDRLF